MSSDLITYELDGAVAVIGLNRPEKRNAINNDVVIQLRDAVVRAGGFRISDGFISPLDLVDLGLHSLEEAHELHALETSRQAA